MEAPKMKTHALQREAEAAQTLLDTIRDVAAGDDDLILDMIEGETSLFEAIDIAVMSRWEDLAHAKALGDLIGNLQARKRRLEDRAEVKRLSIQTAMEMADIRKLERPTCTISLKAVAPAVNVADEASIPSDYWKPQPPKLDKRMLLADLKDGVEIPGATLTNGGETIQIRGQ
jgi:hypothetical protein